jgi:catechol 2,3-dioxygenase-like lactoylglutathione lyase family enzyme
MTNDLTNGRVVAFALATDMDEAQRFYVDVLDLELISRDGFGMMLKSGQGAIRISSAPVFTPQIGTVIGWEVADVRAAAQWLTSRGVELMRNAGMDQDELGVWSPPGGGGVAWFRDPAGNTLSISSHR